VAVQAQIDTGVAHSLSLLPSPQGRKRKEGRKWEGRKEERRWGGRKDKREDWRKKGRARRSEEGNKAHEAGHEHIHSRDVADLASYDVQSPPGVQLADVWED
jgi:hypothetical protein